MRYLHKRFTLLAVVVGSSIIISGGVQAQTITDLFNTGVDAGKVKIIPGNTTTVDLHYTSAARVLQFPNGSWAASADSNYIAPDGNTGDGVYSLAYSTTFTLPLNTNLSSVSIAGQWSTDNSGSNILINGTPTGLTSPSFNPFTNFVL
ncbi:MAG: alkaline phosphatase, partial [Chthonomonadales bacterium]|nr:alkaline phosphatase [Chthonomonadales bacterium]